MLVCVCVHVHIRVVHFDMHVFTHTYILLTYTDYIVHLYVFRFVT